MEKNPQRSTLFETMERITVNLGTPHRVIRPLCEKHYATWRPPTWSLAYAGRPYDKASTQYDDLGFGTCSHETHRPVSDLYFVLHSWETVDVYKQIYKFIMPPRWCKISAINSISFTPLTAAEICAFLIHLVTWRKGWPAVTEYFSRNMDEWLGHFRQLLSDQFCRIGPKLRRSNRSLTTSCRGRARLALPSGLYLANSRLITGLWG